MSQLDLFGACQRWRSRRASYVVPDTRIDPRQFEVATLEHDAAQAFVREHHYSGTWLPRITRTYRHPGCHRYVWALDRPTKRALPKHLEARRIAVSPYPKNMFKEAARG